MLCRASFGVQGANVPALLRAIVACGWFGIQTWIGALALNTLLTAAWPGWTDVPGGIAIAFAIVLAVPGRDHRRRHRAHQNARQLRGAGADHGGACCCSCGAIKHGGGFGHILAESQRLQGKDASNVSFWKLFPPALTANVGYWATLSLNIPDFTRYARSQRSQVIGQALGLPTTMTAFAFIGVAVTSATIVIFGEADLGSGGARDEDRDAGGDHHRDARRASRRSCTRTWRRTSSRRRTISRTSVRKRISFVTRRNDHGGDRHPDDAVEALRGRVGVHLHVADRLLEPHGRARRHSHRRLLGACASSSLSLPDLFKERRRLLAIAAA